LSSCKNAANPELNGFVGFGKKAMNVAFNGKGMARQSSLQQGQQKKLK